METYKEGHTTVYRITWSDLAKFFGWTIVVPILLFGFIVYVIGVLHFISWGLTSVAHFLPKGPFLP